MIPIRDNVPAANLPVTMWGLIAVNTGIFFLQSGLNEEQLTSLFVNWGVVPARFTGGLIPSAFLTLLTTAFLHGGLLHLIGNMWTLYLFGDNVEDRMGPVRFLIFYLLCAVAASLTHILTNPGSEIPAVGASGAISGVMGAYLFMYPRAGVLVMIPIFFLPFFFELSALIYIGGWFVIQFFSGTMVMASGGAEQGGVAFWAHIGGFVAGIVLHFLFIKRPADQPPANDFPPEIVWLRRTDPYRRGM